MPLPLFAAFQSTVTYFADRIIASSDRWLTHPVTGAVVGVKNQNAGGADARFTPVDLTAAQIASPSTLMIADLDATYRLNAAPYTRYMSNGTALVSLATEAQTNSFAIRAPLPADLVSVVNAVTPTNVALTIAAQPVHARKLQVRVVIDTTHVITAGILTLVGTDIDGNAITEAISLVNATSATVKSTYAYAKLTSATVSAIAITGGAGSTTVGLGVSNDFGVPGALGAVGTLTVSKAVKITTDFTGGTVVAADDVAATATVDAVARTIAPTTAPDANGLIDYSFAYSFA